MRDVSALRQASGKSIRAICVMDRESDAFALYDEVRRLESVEVVVRARHTGAWPMDKICLKYCLRAQRDITSRCCWKESIRSRFGELQRCHEASSRGRSGNCAIWMSGAA